MQLTESSIFVGLKRLRNMLYHAQFLMDKSARIIYGTPLMEANGKAIACFTLAFEVRHKRMEYLEECIGWFAVLRMDLDFCISQNIIHYPHDKKNELISDEQGQPITVKTTKEVSSMKIELYKVIAQIDNDISKWRASLAKGKTVVG